MPIRSVRGNTHVGSSLLTRVVHRLTDPRTSSRAGDPQPRAFDTRPTHVALVSVALFCVNFAVGCKCEGNSKRPFTPFGVATEVRPATGPANTEVTSSDAPGESKFSRVVGQLVNPPAAKVQVGDWEVRAPDNQFIAQYVAANVNDQPGVEVVAWLVGGAQTADKVRGDALMLFQRDVPPKLLMGFPAFVPRSESCSLETELAATGPTTVTWDVAANCAAGTLIPRSPHRSLSVIAPLHPNPVRLHLRLAEPIAGERVRVETRTEDVDGDGHDDATVSFELQTSTTTGGAPDEPGAVKVGATKTTPAGARLVWLDRAAGMARDNSEPKKSLTAVGNLETVRAKGQNTSRLVSDRVGDARRLFAYLCKESATFRVTDADGAPITCGDVTSALDSWATAEVTASLTQRHYARAVLAFEQASWFGTGLSEKATKAIEKQLRAAIPTKPVTAKTLDVQAPSPAPGPHYAPLRFVEDDLLIATGRGIQRFRGETLEDASDEVDAWTFVAFGPQGQRLEQLAFPCNEATVFGSSQGNNGTFGTALTTDILSPRPGLCAGRAAVPDIEFRPIAWTPEGLSAYVGPVAVGPVPRFRQPGSPQSNNGAWSVSSGKLGLLVQGASSAEWWSSTETRLTDCVIADSGTRAACLRGNHVVVLSPSPP